MAKQSNLQSRGDKTLNVSGKQHQKKQSKKK
jgi:hypothetical protein